MEITNELSLQDWTGTQLLSIVKNMIDQGNGQKPGLNDTGKKYKYISKMTDGKQEER